MRDSYSSSYVRRLDRDEVVARSAAGTPINDGSGRIVRNGRIVSAQDVANSAATRARDAAFARQTGQYADRSGTVDPNAEGRAAFAASMAASQGSSVRRLGSRGVMAGEQGSEGASLSPITRSALTLKRAYQDLGAIRADTREQKIEIAKDAGLFEPVRRDWNARNERFGKVMDEGGKIHDMNTPATDPDDSASDNTQPAQLSAPLSWQYFGPSFSTPQSNAENLARVKSEQSAAQARRDEDMARALGITVEELRRRRATRRLGQAAPVTAS